MGNFFLGSAYEAYSLSLEVSEILSISAKSYISIPSSSSASGSP